MNLKRNRLILLAILILLVPLAYLLSRYTDISILPLYAICQCVEIIKSITGYFMVKSGVWIQNIVER